MVRNLAYSLIGVLSQVFGTAFIFFVIARALGPEKFGQFSVYYAVAAILKMVVDFGYPQRFLKDFRNDNQQYGGIRFRVFHLKAGLAILLTFCAAGFWGVQGFDPLLFGIVFLYSLVLSSAQLFSCAMQGLSWYKSDSINYFSAAITGCTLALALLFLQCDQPVTFALVMLVQALIYFLLSFRLFQAHSTLVFEPLSWTALKDEFKSGIVYAADVFAMRSFMYLDVVVLSLFVSSSIVGVYQAGQKLVQGVMPLSQAINNVMLPKLSKNGAIRPGTHKYLLGVMTVLGGVGLLGFYGVGEVVISLIYGDAYNELTHYLLFYGMIVFLRYSSFASSVILTASGNQKIRLYVNVVSVAIMVILGSILTYYWSIVGMLSTLIIAASFTWAAYYWGARSKILASA